MFKLVVLSTILAVAASHVIAPLAYVSAPLVQNTVTYASEPVVAGYRTDLIKPSLTFGLETPSETVQKQEVLAPVRSVVNIQPEITVAEVPIVSNKVIAAVPAPIVSKSVISTPALAKVGETVEQIPTAVSHQSSTVVHSKAAVVTPVVAPTLERTVYLSAPYPQFNNAVFLSSAPNGEYFQNLNGQIVQTW